MATEVGTIGQPAVGAEAAAPAKTVEQAGEVRLARIESLRAIGALGILIAHAWYDGQVVGGNPTEVADTYFHRLILSGGLGISLLFGLSGHLMFWPFVQQLWGNKRPVNLRNYALNRVLRVFPLYFILMVVLLLLQEHGGTFEQWWRFSLFAENSSSSTVGTVNGPMWSLVVELHFYILLPLGAWLLARLARNNMMLGAVLLGACGLASLAVHFHFVANMAHPDVRKEYSLPCQFGFICAGMMMAILRLAWKDGLPKWLKSPFDRADVWFFGSLPLWLWVVHDYRYFALTAIAASMVIGSCVLPLRPSPLLKWLDLRAVVAIGVASYSLYLWHVPIQLWMDDTLGGVLGLFLVACPICIAVALLSYRFIESPFLRLRKRWSVNAPAQTGG